MPGVDLWNLIRGEHEEVVFVQDPPTGLRAIVAIHSTALGPALGGTRFYPYASDDDALVDVIRLSRAMTYKSAVAGLDLGGGKAVVIGDPAAIKSEALLRAYGRFLDSLGGRYLTAEDVGTTQADMDTISRETRCVTGTSVALGGSGDPSPATAQGLRWAMHAVARHLRSGGGSAISAGGPTGGDLDDLSVVISGVGKVGSSLARLLQADGAKVMVTDVDREVASRVADELGVGSAGPAATAHTVPCDVFAPCALGGVLNELTIPQLQCRAIVGAANNQLLQDGDAALLSSRGIVYAPDFVVNAGGVINIAEELTGYDPDRAAEAVRRVGASTAEVLARAAAEGTTTVEAAMAVGAARIAAVSGTRRIRRFDRLHPSGRG